MKKDFNVVNCVGILINLVKNFKRRSKFTPSFSYFKVILLLLNIILFSTTYAQNLVKNGDFEYNKKSFVLNPCFSNPINFKKFDSSVNINTKYILDSLVYDWSLLFGCPQYSNFKLTQIYGLKDTLGFWYDSLPKPFKNNAYLWWTPKLQTTDTINFTIDTFYDTFKMRYDYFGLRNAGVYQKFDSDLLKDSTYVLSFRFKLGSEIRNKDNLYSSILSNITAALTTYKINATYRQLDLNKLKIVLNDNYFDTSYSWRLLTSEFIADSVYNYINFLRTGDAVSSSYKMYNNLLKSYSKSYHSSNGNYLGNIYYCSLFIDDVRLLPKWQFLKISKDTFLCENHFTTLRVLSGAGPYSWRKAGQTKTILSTADSLVVSPTDTMEIYEVLSPYDTASVVVYLNKNKFTISDTTYFSNCNNVPIIVNTPNNAKWSDGIVSYGSRSFNNSGNYFYTQKVNCSTKIKNYFISIHKEFKDTIKAELCSSPYIFRGKQYDSSGIFTINYPSQYGCDSSYTIDLKIKIVQNKIQHSGFNYTSQFPVPNHFLLHKILR